MKNIKKKKKKKKKKEKKNEKKKKKKKRLRPSPYTSSFLTVFMVFYFSNKN